LLSGYPVLVLGSHSHIPISIRNQRSDQQFSSILPYLEVSCVVIDHKIMDHFWKT